LWYEAADGEAEDVGSIEAEGIDEDERPCAISEIVFGVTPVEAAPSSDVAMPLGQLQRDPADRDS
jgi:hypothetical protein